LRSQHAQRSKRSGIGTFLVFGDGECIPLDGPMRVELLRGSYYLLGRRSWERFESLADARRRLVERAAGSDPDGVAGETLEALADDALDAGLARH